MCNFALFLIHLECFDDPLGHHCIVHLIHTHKLLPPPHPYRSCIRAMDNEERRGIGIIFRGIAL